MPSAFKDPEKQNFNQIFVVLAAALLLVLVWELYEELFGRQPWKSFQESFKNLEISQLNEELRRAEARLQEKQKRLAGSPLNAQPTTMENYELRLQKLQSLLDSPQYRNLLTEETSLKSKLQELDVQRRFLKADLDAAYYVRDNAVEKAEEAGQKDVQGKPLPGATDIGDLEEKLQKNQKESESVSGRLKQVSAGLRLTEDAIAEVKRGMDTETSEVASLRQRLAKVTARPPTIRQVVATSLGEYERVDRCQTCHQGIDRAEFINAKELVFRTHPNFEQLFRQHPLEKVGCTSCHDGQGRALNVEEAHSGGHHWHAPLLAKNMVQSSCVRCHENAPLLEDAHLAAEGAALFQTKGCMSCHKVEGSAYLTVDAPKLGPQLTQEKGKVEPKWLATWIKDPKKIHARTAMPEFGDKGVGIKDDEAIALAAYIWSNSADSVLSPAACRYLKEHQVTPVSIARGKALFDQRGCLGCHEVGDLKAAGSRHVSLDGAGSKLPRQWIYSWIEDPSAMAPNTVMPKFPLTAEEIACLSDYVSSLKTTSSQVSYLNINAAVLSEGDRIDHGRQLVKKYGCYSCHRIPGFTAAAEKIGPELSDYSSKDPNLLFWGTQNAVPPEKRNWYTWTAAKLNEPKVFQTDRVAVAMPNFHLQQDEIDRLVVFLKTLSTEKTIAKTHRRLLKPGEADRIAGTQLLNSYGCLGCHSLYDGKPQVKPGGLPVSPPLAYGALAPNLSVEGDRVRADWLSDFLNQPYKMRPYLPATMPAFHFRGNDQAALVAYFRSGATAPLPAGFKDTQAVSPVSDQSNGARLLSQYQCYTCHQVKGKESAPTSGIKWYHDLSTARRLAPDLSFAPARLNSEWADRWIENPHAIMPDTTMPFLAITREEASAIRSYLAATGSATVPVKTSGRKLQ